MSAQDLVLAAGLAVVFAAAFGTLFDLAPVIAKAMVRQAARWWHSELDTPEELAAEWQALIEARPVGIMKIGTGLRFWLRGAVRHGQFVVERRHARSPQTLSGVLVWLSGARKEILDACPTERPKYVGVASAILITSTTAAASLTFALVTVLRVGLWVAVPFAFAWGLAILGIDRWLAVSLRRQERWWNYLLVACPRLLLALLFGMIISTPFVLQIFRPEIEQQITVMQAQRSGAYFAHQINDPLGKAIRGDRVRIATLEHAFNTATAAQAASAAEARFMLRAAEQTLAQDQLEQRNLTSEFIRANSSSHGLLLWLQALDDITSQSTMLSTARFLVFLLFVIIECLPVLVKTLLLVGPESLYEKLAAIDEQARLRIVREESRCRRRSQGP